MRTTVLSIVVLLSINISMADYRIVWSTIDGGGGTSSGGAYQLTGTIGQPDAGYHSGGHYELLAGFWTGGPLCIVNLEHFAQFAAFWLDGPCNADNNWCGGADLNHLDNINVDDLIIFAGEWLNVCPYTWPLQ